MGYDDDNDEVPKLTKAQAIASMEQTRQASLYGQKEIWRAVAMEKREHVLEYIKGMSFIVIAFDHATGMSSRTSNLTSEQSLAILKFMAQSEPISETVTPVTMKREGDKVVDTDSTHVTVENKPSKDKSNLH